MNDQEALDLIVKYHQMINSTTSSLIANLQYEVIAEDQDAAQKTNIPGGTYIGKNLLTMTSDPWRSDVYKQILDECLINKTGSKWISLKFRRNPEFWLIIISFEPLINNVTNNVIGYKVSGEPALVNLSFFSIKELIKNSIQNNLELEKHTDDLLTSKEHEVLFLLFYSDNYQNIADLLSLSHQKTITSSMVAKVVSRGLYVKFNVYNLESLKQEAYRLSYHKKVPATLFGEFMFPISHL